MPDNQDSKGNQPNKGKPDNGDKAARPTLEKRGGYTGGQPKASVKPPVNVPSQSMKPSASQTKGPSGSDQTKGPSEGK